MALYGISFTPIELNVLDNILGQHAATPAIISIQSKVADAINLMTTDTLYFKGKIAYRERL